MSVFDLDVEVLQGPSNYTRWERQMKVLATAHNVYELLRGREKLLDKPERPPAPNPNSESYRIKPSMSPEEKTGVQQALQDATNEYAVAIQTYKMDLED